MSDISLQFWEVAALAKELLDTASTLAGVPIVAEGVFPQTVAALLSDPADPASGALTVANFEEQRIAEQRALNELGLLVKVLSPAAAMQSQDQGHLRLDVDQIIVVAENLEINTAAGGTQIPVLIAARQVIGRLNGRPEGKGGPKFRLAENVFDRMGDEPGLLDYAINFRITTTLR